MSETNRKGFSRIRVILTLVILTGCFLAAGCTSTPNQLDPSATSPQIVVNPGNVRLGVAYLTGTDIVFEGSGFEPEDSVFISLIGPEDTEIAVADATVKADGTFQAKAGALGKVAGMLRADVAGKYKEDGSYEQFIVLTQDPIPTGTYKVRATGMLSDVTAETQINVMDPGLTDRFKDWLGKKMGKIVDKRAS